MLSRILNACGIVRVQSWDVAARPPAALDQVVGAVWPRETGAVASGLVEVLCIGPTDWFVIGRNPEGSELYGELGAVLTGSPLRSTDVSQGLVRIEVEGPDVREFLLKGCSLDLHPDCFPAGRCARTRLAGVPVVLWCRDASRFEVIVGASHREYLLAWIADAS
jgi:sarcosine oxidase subunit gamma